MVNYSKTIEVYDYDKVSIYSKLNQYMKIYQQSMSFFEFCPRNWISGEGYRTIGPLVCRISGGPLRVRSIAYSVLGLLSLWHPVCDRLIILESANMGFGEQTFSDSETWLSRNPQRAFLGPVVMSYTRQLSVTCETMRTWYWLTT